MPTFGFRWGTLEHSRISSRTGRHRSFHPLFLAAAWDSTYWQDCLLSKGKGSVDSHHDSWESSTSLCYSLGCYYYQYRPFGSNPWKSQIFILLSLQCWLTPLDRTFCLHEIPQFDIFYVIEKIRDRLILISMDVISNLISPSSLPFTIRSQWWTPIITTSHGFRNWWGMKGSVPS